GAISVAGGNLLAVALAHGLTIAVFVSATGHISGGQLNPAVTLGLFVARKMTLADSARYVLSQLAGAVSAGLVCLVLFDRKVVIAGTPAIDKLSVIQGISVEAILTFFLVFVVFGTAVDPRGPKIGGLAIGLTVTLDILFGGPLTGAAMNPARVFGPAVAANFWAYHYVYWVGPLLGGAAAGALYGRVFLPRESTARVRSK
ncbi:MAG: aquaporin, partial [Verrucomicrobiota bacterium]|nr:aquaporin [Verrucomicrobiota bacterium]